MKSGSARVGEKALVAVSWFIIIIVFFYGAFGWRWLTLNPFRGKVCIRLDDVQDSWMWEGQTLLMDYFISKKAGMTLGVVSGMIGDDQRLLDRIQHGVNLGLFEVALHGWNNENMSKMDYQQQLDLLQRGRDRLGDIFQGTTIVTLIPPMNEFNDDTLSACEDSGFGFISASILTYSAGSESTVKQFHETVETADYRSGFEGSAWMPYSAERIIESIKDSLDKYSFAVVTIHPQQFYNWVDDSPVGLNAELFNDFMKVLDWIRENMSPMQIQQLDDSSPFEVSNPAVYYAVGLLILGPVVLLYRRKRAHRQ